MHGPSPWAKSMCTFPSGRGVLFSSEVAPNAAPAKATQPSCRTSSSVHGDHRTVQQVSHRPGRRIENIRLPNSRGSIPRRRHDTRRTKMLGNLAHPAKRCGVFCGHTMMRPAKYVISHSIVESMFRVAGFIFGTTWAADTTTKNTTSICGHPYVKPRKPAEIPA